MKKLHEGTARELLFTQKGKRIIVETKKDIQDRKVRRKQKAFLIESISLIIAGAILGACIITILTK